ncbi:19464_t:CDS:2, partial [Racocetra fulgida]
FEEREELLHKIELENIKFKRYERGELDARIEHAKKEVAKRRKERAEKKKNAEA